VVEQSRPQYLTWNSHGERKKRDRFGSPLVSCNYDWRTFVNRAVIICKLYPPVVVYFRPAGSESDFRNAFDHPFILTTILRNNFTWIRIPTTNLLGGLWRIASPFLDLLIISGELINSCRHSIKSKHIITVPTPFDSCRSVQWNLHLSVCVQKPMVEAYRMSSMQNTPPWRGSYVKDS